MIAFLFTFVEVKAQVIIDNNYIDSIQNRFVNETQSAMEDFDEYVSKARAEYEKYDAQARADYARFVQKVKHVWNCDTIIDDTKYTWVEYGENLMDRSIVNFQSGDIDVEVVVDETSSASATRDALVNAIERLLYSRGSTCPYASSVDESRPISEHPILQGLVEFSQYDFSSLDSADISSQKKLKRQTPPKPSSQGKDLNLKDRFTVQQPLSPNKKTSKGKTLATQRLDNQKKAEMLLKQKRLEAEKRKLAELIVEQSEQEDIPMKKTVTSSGKKKTVKLHMRLVANNISKNAVLYKDIVKQNSKKFHIEEPLIYAVMEQESSFNPEATSWVPAYGLMQLVPHSGGLEAYRFVYKTEWIPTKSYLFVPSNNIELGTAYLRVLMNLFERVADPDCRRLCVIAGYNTGPGNVSRSFTGKRNLNHNVFLLINQYNYQELFNYLTHNLNTREARNYVKGVSRRREKYL